MSSWSAPETRTRTGASHARKGSVCQDFSDWLSVSDRSGRPVQLMAVADGHGGHRYTRSEVGSALACQLALERLGEQLEQWSSGGVDASQRWLAWLRDVFPRELHQRWLEAVEHHWRQEAAGGAADFSPLPYGTTLALVVMTPGWWGHTGLGDWDLVRLEPGGTAELLSEEAEPEQGGGEATYSLCLSQAHRHFAARTAVYPLTPQQPAFSLLLSTDGVRKSCSTDADFFTIAHYLCGKADRDTDLDADLDRISSQGSGDDVSVAIARWRGGASGPATPRRPPGRRGAASGPEPLPAHGSTSCPDLQLWISLTAMGLLLAGGGLAGAWFGLGWRPPSSLESLLGHSRPQPPPLPPPPPAWRPQLEALTSVTDQLCGQPERIDDLLNNYGKQAYTTLRADPSQRRRLLDLATGASEPDQISPEQIGALVAWAMGPSRPPDQLQQLGACLELSQKLASALARWAAPQASGAPKSPNR